MTTLTSSYAAEPNFDPKDFRNALGNFATGVTVITTKAADGQLIGLTANSFSSVSLDPPMVLWSLSKKAYSLPVFMEAKHWTVHVLASDQEDLSNRFARAGEDKFSGMDVEFCPNGIPLLSDCVARFQCETYFRYEGGDHIIFVGKVLSYQRSDREPLVFHGGRYALAALRSKPEPIRSVDGFSENLIGRLLGRSYHQLMLGVRPALREAGLTDASWHITTALTVKNGLNTEEIRQAVYHSFDGPIQPEIDALLAADWIYLDPSSNDGHYRFTESGRTRSLDLLGRSKEGQAEIVSKFSSAEIEILTSLLRKIIKFTNPGNLPDLWSDNVDSN